MALTRENLVRSGGRDGVGMAVNDTDQQFAGGLVGGDPATGRCRKWRNTAGDKWMGVGQTNVTGDTAGTKSQRVDLTGPVRYNVIVTGVTGEANVFDRVECVDDGPTYILTAAGVEIGTIVRWHSGEVCDVMLDVAAI